MHDATAGPITTAILRGAGTYCPEAIVGLRQPPLVRDGAATLDQWAWLFSVSLLHRRQACGSANAAGDEERSSAISAEGNALSIQVAVPTRTNRKFARHAKHTQNALPGHHRKKQKSPPTR